MNQLARIDTASAEAALPAELVARATEYIHEAKSDRTRRAYAQAWAQFGAWCSAHGRCALPCSPETLAAWIVALAEGADGRKPRSRATIGQYSSAVVAAQRAAGYEFDRQHAVLKGTLAGVRRVKARTEVVRKAAPLMAKDLHAMLRHFTAHKPRDVRDGALLSIGWAGALRRNEIVQLDWLRVGEGKGFVTLSERGIVITLTRSKGSQDGAAEIVLPADDMPSAVHWLQAWATTANLQPGEPVFRPIDRRNKISTARLGDAAVSEIVKQRVKVYVYRAGKSKKEAREFVKQFSGHSMRAGFATSAADLDVPLSRLATHTRHKSLETLQGYVRSSEQWRRSPLKGLGF